MNGSSALHYDGVGLIRTMTLCNYQAQSSASTLRLRQQENCRRQAARAINQHTATGLLVGRLTSSYSIKIGHIGDKVLDKV